jgi:arginyl-tRNA synthetase
MGQDSDVAQTGSILGRLTGIFGDAFAAAGFARELGEVASSNRPDLGEFQCNGALAAAKRYKQNPAAIAEQVVAELARLPPFGTVTVTPPGFLNVRLDDRWLADVVTWQQASEGLGAAGLVPREKVLVDYGGANVAKPLHVGHLRAAIIGEALKRIGRFLGDSVIGDVHLGDWGLQMGMLLHEISLRSPDLPYFDPTETGPYPETPPVTVDELDNLYPIASEKAKNDPAYMEAARRATMELQAGRPGYRALWQHLVNVSMRDLEADYRNLDVEFDYWLGESHAHADSERLVEELPAEGKAVVSQGALVIPVEEEGDTAPLPPLMLAKSDGAFTYGTTDLATIAQRVRDFSPDLILYVVDARQRTHFQQVFRAAKRTGVAPPSLRLEHIYFGTMNGLDGKPFRTRAGGTTKLKDLIAQINEYAMARLDQLGEASDLAGEEKAAVARMVGIATLKFADLSNHRTKDYIFDPERFSAFEGKTGPYLLYTAVRARAVLRKAEERGIAVGELLPPFAGDIRQLVLTLAEFPDAVAGAWNLRAPNLLCDYAFRLAAIFNTFYHEHPILREEDEARRGSYLWLTRAVATTLVRAADLLGMEVPERM